MNRRGLFTSTTSVFLVVGMLSCSGEQRSGAAPADTAQAARDTVPVAGSDTAASQARDTAPVPSARDTVARQDTTPKAAARPGPQRTQRPPAAVAPRPRTDTAAAPDTVRPTVGSRAQPDTAGRSQPVETTATTPPPATETSAPLRDQYHRAPLDTVPQQVYDGWKQYNLNCARCHGEDVQGTTIAPHLLVSVKPDGPINTKELFVQTVCAGRPEKGMPAWCTLGMEMPTIEAIYAYVKGRSEAKLHPGRPALKAGG